VWWIKLGILPERIEPGELQQNGRHERMHRTLKRGNGAAAGLAIITSAPAVSFPREFPSWSTRPAYLCGGPIRPARCVGSRRAFAFPIALLANWSRLSRLLMACAVSGLDPR